jgi:hypothetical protein
MKKNIIFLTSSMVMIVLLAACNRTTAPNYAEIPAGKAYADGETIFFAHTEVSDAQVGELLSKMMKSPVLVVPALADVPDSALAEVYVFKNGVAGNGPLKFQADVFPNQPGDEGYSPLRKIVFVTWKDESQAVELKSEEDIASYADQGTLTVEESNIVVNMPFMTWKGGQR